VNWVGGQVPNAFGCALGAMQLILYFIYYDKKGGDEKKHTSADNAIELGPATSGNRKAHQAQDEKPKRDAQNGVDGHV